MIDNIFDITLDISNSSEDEIEELIELAKSDYYWAIEELKGKVLLHLFVSRHLTGELIEKLNKTCLKFEIREVVNWEENFRKSFKGVVVSNFFIRPPWEEEKDKFIDIIIYPASSFGVGDHASTQGMLLAIEKIANDGIKVEKALDIGTGSGILSIAIKKLGIAKKVIAIDISELAIGNAKMNVKLNEVEDVFLILGSTYTLNPNQKFDLILANIDSESLPKLKPDILNLISKDGLVIIGGFTNQNRQVLDLYSESLYLKDTIVIEDWITCIYYNK
ncbi:MAG: 50S ribosomal protein L11 methyltransferase [Thermosulfidibacteraceae bacterium]|jgi:ribosomal protein L11 methyltransferase